MSVTATPAITALPDAPQRLTDTAEEFVAKADPFVAALPGFGTQIAAVGAAAQANATEAGTQATAAASSATSASGSATAAATAESVAVAVTSYLRLSTASLTPAAAAKAITGMAAGAGFVNGDVAIAISKANPDSWFYGPVSSMNAGAGTMTITPAGATGFSNPDGAHADWIVMLLAMAPPAVATAAEILAASATRKVITPAGWKAALAAAALVDAATVTPNGQNGLDFTWTIGGSRTLGLITNTYAGARGRITITQDGSGSRILAVASGWKRSGGLGVLSTAAGAVDYLDYDVVAVDGSNTATLIRYAIDVAPS